MKYSLNIYTFTIFALISSLLFVGLNKWFHYLLIKDYIVECFSNQTDNTTHTVNLPINTTYSCKNMCGPYGKCSITGQRCLSDIDCFGCTPSTSEDISNTFLKINEVRGDDDAGKYSFLTPNYSELTTDVGTRAKLLTPSSNFLPPTTYNTGVDVWKGAFDEGTKLYDDVYKTPGMKYMPKYPTRYSLSGEFEENGPLASNAFLP